MALVGCGVVALSSCVSASGAASARGPVTESPVVDADYLYAQLYTMAKGFSYRVSGADGDPRRAADPYNLVPTVNGWQELVGYWKVNLTDRRVNTRLAGFATVSDHFFRRTFEALYGT